LNYQVESFSCRITVICLFVTGSSLLNRDDKAPDIKLDSETLSETSKTIIGPNVTDTDISDVDSTAFSRIATNTVKAGTVLTIAEESVPTANAYAAFSNDEDDDSAFEHNSLHLSSSNILPRSLHTMFN
jgi:hypothetical protein